jgi:hypothetical protein
MVKMAIFAIMHQVPKKVISRFSVLTTFKNSGKEVKAEP